MESIGSVIIAKFNYWAVIVLLLVGLYAMITKKNLVKKIIGMNIFQTAIILFYVSIGAKKGATIPIFCMDPAIHLMQFMLQTILILFLTC